jgi:AAA+ superfamily predicted ATPase
MTDKTNLSPPLKELDNFIDARIPIIWVLTAEESRFIEELNREIVGPKDLHFSYWSTTSGLCRVNRYRSQEEVSGTTSAIKALQHILAEKEVDDRAVYVMKDLFLLPPEIRCLRDAYEDLADQGKTIIIVSPFLAYGPGGTKEGIPPTLEKQICVVEYSLPDHKEISRRIKRATAALQIEYSPTEVDEYSRAVRGLTSLEIENALAICLMSNDLKLDVDCLLQFKRQSIRKSQILEFMDTNVSVDDVGGLDKIKEYFTRYKNSFSQEAKEFGLEPLKMVILCGIPGTGKSLVAKTIGRIYKLPLLKFDIGKVFAGIVGQSESNMRSAIKSLEGMSPCVCMIDEIEKGLSGTRSSGVTDSGVTSKVFGTLLTAIQEGLQDVVLVATANDITSIPPEFLRRANEIFFVDLPSPKERWDILRIHLEKRGRKFSKYKEVMADFLDKSEGFTGAEIEKTVKDAIARAFYDESKDATPEHILDALSEIKPISQVMETQIKELQEWARGHARYASSHSEKQRDSAKEKKEKPNRFKKMGKNLN